MTGCPTGSQNRCRCSCRNTKPRRRSATLCKATLTRGLQCKSSQGRRETIRKSEMALWISRRQRHSSKKRQSMLPPVPGFSGSKQRKVPAEAGGVKSVVDVVNAEAAGAVLSVAAPTTTPPCWLPGDEMKRTRTTIEIHLSSTCLAWRPVRCPCQEVRQHHPIPMRPSSRLLVVDDPTNFASCLLMLNLRQWEHTGMSSDCIAVLRRR
mmetsp:Transcript_27999/g.55038  ORF Transcript_27999/g.55038 Transcript_27999/m.55038 type:complete len:208 (-) Transcript_27999:76-699(-)